MIDDLWDSWDVMQAKYNVKKKGLKNEENKVTNGRVASNGYE